LIATTAVCLTLLLPGSVLAQSTWYIPTEYEQYLLEMINRARAAPDAEAAMFGMDLNEGLPPGTISSTPKQPLAVNLSLTFAAQVHSWFQLKYDFFAHDDPLGDPMTRAYLFGYGEWGTYAVGENIGWQGIYPIMPDVEQFVEDIHRALFEDYTIPGRGHRVGLMNEDIKEAGIGVREGVFTAEGTDWNAVMVSEDFGYKFDDPFFTGVAFQDDDVNDFYSPGEGLSGVIVLAYRPSQADYFYTVTLPAGGYSLQVPAGTYAVFAFGAALPEAMYYADVVIDTKNVKLDFQVD
jgi:hypothetical protein